MRSSEMKPLYLWVESCLSMQGMAIVREQLADEPVTYECLCNGFLLNALFVYIDPRIQTQIDTAVRANDIAIRFLSLRTLLKCILSFYLDMLNQVVIMPLPDVYAIASNPTQEDSGEEMQKLLLLLLGCAVQGERREEFIENIRKFDVCVQEAVAQQIQVVTSEECVLSTQQLLFLSDAPEDTALVLPEQVRRLALQRDELNQSVLELRQQVETWNTELSLSFDNHNETSFASCLSTKSHDAPFKEDKQPSPVPVNTTVDPSQRLATELEDYKAKLRVLRIESEEKSEQLAEYKIDLSEKDAQLSQLRQENQQLKTDASRAKIYRDEVDILYEKAARLERLEMESSRLRERLEELEFYKTRVEELREQNHSLLSLRDQLQDEKKALNRELESLKETKARLLCSEKTLQELQDDLRTEKERMAFLADQNFKLEWDLKMANDKVVLLQSEMDSLQRLPAAASRVRSLSEQLDESVAGELQQHLGSGPSTSSSCQRTAVELSRHFKHILCPEEHSTTATTTTNYSTGSSKSCVGQTCQTSPVRVTTTGQQTDVSVFDDMDTTPCCCKMLDSKHADCDPIGTSCGLDCSTYCCAETQTQTEARSCEDETLLLKQRNEQLSEQYAAALSELQLRTETTAALHERIRSMEMQLMIKAETNARDSELEAQCSSAREQVSVLQKQVSVLQQQELELINEANCLRQQLQQSLSDDKHQRLSIESLVNAETRSLGYHLELLDADNEELRKQLGQLETDHAELIDSFDRLQQLQTKLLQDHEAQNQLHRQFSEEFEQLRVQNTGLQDTIESMKATATVELKCRERLEVDNQNLELKLRGIENEFSIAKERSDSLEQRYEFVANELVRAKTGLRQMKAVFQEMHLKHLELQAYVTQLESNNKCCVCESPIKKLLLQEDAGEKLNGIKNGHYSPAQNGSGTPITLDKSRVCSDVERNEVLDTKLLVNGNNPRVTPLSINGVANNNNSSSCLITKALLPRVTSYSSKQENLVKPISESKPRRRCQESNNKKCSSSSNLSDPEIILKSSLVGDHVTLSGPERSVDAPVVDGSYAIRTPSYSCSNNGGSDRLSDDLGSCGSLSLSGTPDSLRSGSLPSQSGDDLTFKNNVLNSKNTPDLQAMASNRRNLIVSVPKKTIYEAALDNTSLSSELSISNVSATTIDLKSNADLWFEYGCV